jgi:hypothetical protein
MPQRNEQSPVIEGVTSRPNQKSDAEPQTNLQRTVIETMLLQACEEKEDSDSGPAWEELRKVLAEEVSFPWFFRQQ